MKRIRGIISFVLVFFLVISFLPLNDAYAITGSLKSGGGGIDSVGYGGSGNGDSGLFAFRIKAVPMNPSNMSYSHFNVDWNNKTVTMKSNVYNSDDEKDYSSWKYITPINADRAYRYVTHGREHLISMSGGVGSPTNDYHKLIKILGIKDGTKIESWDEALRNYNGEKGVPIYNGDALGKFFGIKSGGYYIVVERLRALVNQNGNQYDSKDYRHAKFTWFTYRDFKDMQTQSLLRLKELGVGSSSMNLFSGIGYYINQGDTPPAHYKYTKDSAEWAGHAVYFDPNKIPDDGQVTLNVTAELTAEPGEATGTLFRAPVLLKNNTQYWDTDSEEFKTPNGMNTIRKGSSYMLTNATGKTLEKYLNIDDSIDLTPPYTFVAGKLYHVTLKDNMNIDAILSNTSKMVKNTKFEWRHQPVASENNSAVLGDITTLGNPELDTMKYINSKSSNVTKKGQFNRKTKIDNYLDGFYTDTALKYFENSSLYSSLLVSYIDGISKGANSEQGVFDEKKREIVKGKRLGLSVSYLAKASKVVTNKITLTVKVDKKGNKSVTSKETALSKYTNLDSVTIPASDGAIVSLAIPYTGNKPKEAVDLLKSLPPKKLKISSEVYNALTNLYKTKLKYSTKSPKPITVGHISSPDGVESNITGYTIYEVITKVKDPDGGGDGGGGGNTPDPESGKVELPAYMLNRYFPNIINTSSDGKIQYQAGRDFTVKKELYKDQATCLRCGTVFFPITQPHRHQDWNIEWRDQSSSGYHIALDNKNRGRYFPSMPSGVWGSAKRSVLSSWTSQNTEGWSDPSGKIIDYGFNLIRASVKDNKALSGITYKTYDVVDKGNVLQFKPYFGVSPVSSPLRASSLRNSMALAGKVSDTITVASRFARYHGTGFNEKLNHHFEPEIGHNVTHTSSGKNADGSTWTNSWTEYVVDKPEVNIDWYTFPTKTASGIRINGSSANSFTYTFESNVRKYQTATMGTGENEKISGGSTAVDINAFSPREGEVTDGNEYRFANVRNNGVTHSFYPEVNMVYKIDGTQYDGSSPYRIASTMGEVLRKSKSSSLYLFKVNGVGQTTTGVTYSDSALGGTVSRGSKGVVIPAGADVHIKAEPKNITIDLYAYALDSINADTDSTFKPEKFTSHRYTDIVASGKNVDTEWNGKANRPALIKHFSDWADDILDIRNFSADFELHVRGIKKASNFSAVVGDIKRNKSIAEDGVYQLQFKKGTLLANRDYSLLIKQIANDYQCSESEAEGVFKASGIYTSILNAIESSSSDINNSGKAQLGSVDWTNDLGSEGNWYDEYVNTFVVRRFTNKGNKINSITATDKIDYGLAPDGSERRLQNANYNRVNRAFWKLSIFFNPARAKEVKDLLVDRGSFYDPSKRWSKFSEARDSFTVLMHGVRVQRADFGISADSTKDF